MAGAVVLDDRAAFFAGAEDFEGVAAGAVRDAAGEADAQGGEGVEDVVAAEEA